MRYISLLLCLFTLSCAAADSDWYFGTWEVSDAEFPGMSAMGMEQAETWFGSELTYTPAKVAFRDERCDSPTFTTSSLTGDEFYASYRATLQALGIAGEQVEIVEVGCPDNWIAAGSKMIKAGSDSAYILWDGVFFRVEKQASGS
ncbi:hypothetical protein CWE12_07225 [Aliidiomarina sedimenti]|uniref:Lipocalin-like domain-containing protein n=1 Tax=Aliidiomarina sedimenti TaxID=1933879 RepID=A0ABY0BZ00_9GAMM|nr:hypothetical protein [Aliidiomarina sedimenti]RUO29756.1 hypothetical protein CWE12_07225 [Aliidiomarina sedimenti]